MAGPKSTQTIFVHAYIAPVDVDSHMGKWVLLLQDLLDSMHI
jgi:hypothetical protein